MRRPLIVLVMGAWGMEGWRARERAYVRPTDAERWIALNAVPYAR